MESIYNRNRMYMSDGGSCVVSEFDIMDDSLTYTLDFNTKDGLSVFSNVYDTEHEEDTWTICVDEKNLFYPALYEFLSSLPSIVFKDERFATRKVKFTIKNDNCIYIIFTVPGNKYNLANVKIGLDDPHYDDFLNLFNSLNSVFTKEKTK